MFQLLFFRLLCIQHYAFINGKKIKWIELYFFFFYVILHLYFTSKGDVAELVDAADLKSADCIDREGSSPSLPNIILNTII